METAIVVIGGLILFGLILLFFGGLEIGYVKGVDYTTPPDGDGQ